MSTPNECPICMDTIDPAKNCVTTECGHCFHTKCLMNCVAHNGFGCPYCRSMMAEEIKKEDDEWSYEEDDEDEEDEDMFNEDALRGFRFFMNNVHGEPHEQEDIDEEEEDEEEDDTEENGSATPEQAIPKPIPSFIAQKLTDEGVTIEQLVKTLLLDHDEYDEYGEVFERIEDELFGRIRRIVTNYTPDANNENNLVETN